MINFIIDNILFIPIGFLVGSYFFLFYKDNIRTNHHTIESDQLINRYCHLKRVRKV